MLYVRNGAVVALMLAIETCDQKDASFQLVKAAFAHPLISEVALRKCHGEPVYPNM